MAVLPHILQHFSLIFLSALLLCVSAFSESKAAQPIESTDIFISLDLSDALCPWDENERAESEDPDPPTDECGVSVSCDLLPDGGMVIVVKNVYCLDRDPEMMQHRAFFSNQIGTFNALLTLPSAEPLPGNGSLPGPESCSSALSKLQRADPPLLPPPRNELFEV